MQNAPDAFPDDLEDNLAEAPRVLKPGRLTRTLSTEKELSETTKSVDTGPPSPLVGKVVWRESIARSSSGGPGSPAPRTGSIPTRVQSSTPETGQYDSVAATEKAARKPTRIMTKQKKDGNSSPMGGKGNDSPMGKGHYSSPSPGSRRDESSPADVGGDSKSASGGTEKTFDSPISTNGTSTLHKTLYLEDVPEDWMTAREAGNGDTSLQAEDGGADGNSSKEDAANVVEVEGGKDEVRQKREGGKKLGWGDHKPPPLNYRPWYSVFIW